MSTLSGSLEKELDPLREADDIMGTGDRKHNYSTSILSPSSQENLSSHREERTNVFSGFRNLR